MDDSLNGGSFGDDDLGEGWGVQPGLSEVTVPNMEEQTGEEDLSAVLRGDALFSAEFDGGPGGGVWGLLLLVRRRGFLVLPSTLSFAWTAGRSGGASVVVSSG